MEKKEIQAKVIEIILTHAQYGAKEIDTGANLQDSCGIDSIILVEILTELESLFNIEVDSNLLTYDNFSTVDKIVDYISGLKAGSMQ